MGGSDRVENSELASRWWRDFGKSVKWESFLLRRRRRRREGTDIRSCVKKKVLNRRCDKRKRSDFLESLFQVQYEEDDRDYRS